MAPVIDGHNDLLWTLRMLNAYDADLGDTLADTHTDLGRLRTGGVGAQFWSVFVAVELGDDAVKVTLEQIDAAHSMMARHPELASATTADEIERAWADGRIASLLGAEGGHQIGSSLGTLRMLYRLGVRYLTLTHNFNVPWADSATDTPVLGGLNEFGREVVREMNRIGMMVDLSHVSEGVMHHALDVTSAPVIFSHSSARAVCGHVRNVPDDVLVRLAANEGVCMVTFVPRFVSPAVFEWTVAGEAIAVAQGIDPKSLSDLDEFLASYALTHPAPRATIDDVVAHLEHVREVAGIDHVGLGGDYDGVPELPIGLEDVSCYPRLLAALTERGWSTRDLDKLTHLNVLRVMRAVEAAAHRG